MMPAALFQTLDAGWDELIGSRRDASLPTLAVMMDRGKGLRAGIRDVLPSAVPRICVKHLERNLKTKWAKNGSSLADVDSAMK